MTRHADRDVFSRTAEVFELLRHVPGARRDARLRELCGGDATLEAEVRALMRFHDAETGPLDDAVVQPGAALVGPYRLKRRLGEGGMGTVWLARQERPVERLVAVKVIKVGMDTRAVVRRFETERRVLARMDHPGIARVIDAGATPDGRPYFAMEYVRGRPLLDWCDARRLGVRERVELFVDVCRAVAHAHQKGVLHRDLKPSNILVTDVDGRPAPKVIDFGVAKAVVGGEESATLLTDAGSVIGTPDYMSPEQAQPGGDVDTRSDLFSLGVVLYELLTGTTPRAAERTTSRRGATLGALTGILRGDAPMRPSSAVEARHGDDAMRAAECRATDRRGLQRALRGDLDWIVLRAVAPEPEARYASVTALAEDLRRFLASEPVEARPPSFTYVASRLARRHAGALAAVAAVVVALVLGLAVALSGWRAARIDRDAAIAAGERERAISLTLADELHESQVTEGRTAAQAGNMRAARDRLWQALHDRPDSMVAKWGLRELMLRHPNVASTALIETPPYSITTLDDSRVLVGRRHAPPMLVSLDVPPKTEFLDGPPMLSRQLAADPRGRFAVSANTDGTVHAWDLAAGCWLGIIRDHGLAIAATAALGDGRFVTGGADGTVALVDLERGTTTLQPWTTSGAAVTRLASHASGRVAIGFADGEVALVDPDGRRRTLAPHDASISSLVFSTDGRRLASGSTGRDIKVHGVDDGAVIGAWPSTSGTVRDLCFLDERGDRLAVAGWWDVNTIDVATGAIERLLPDVAWRMTLARGGRSLVFVTGESGSIRHWFLEPPCMTLDDGSTEDDVPSVAAVSETGVPHALDAAARPSWPEDDVAVVTTRGARLALRDGDGGVQWSITGSSAISTLAFAEDGSTLAVGFRGEELFVVNAAGEIVATFNDYRPGQRHAAALHAGRGLVAFAAPGGSIRLRSLDGSLDRTLLTDNTREVLSVTFAPDGHALFVTTRYGMVHRIDLGTDQVTTWRSASTIFASAFTSDGSKLICGSWRGLIQIFEHGAAPPITLRGHGRLVNCLAPHPTNASLLLSGDVNGEVRVWDLDRWRCVFMIEPFDPPSAIRDISLSADGDAVRIVSADGRMAGWSWSDLDARITANREHDILMLEAEDYRPLR